jgi:hypothetical protein
VVVVINQVLRKNPRRTATNLKPLMPKVGKRRNKTPTSSRLSVERKYYRTSKVI